MSLVPKIQNGQKCKLILHERKLISNKNREEKPKFKGE
jgi:hypothetical protein